MPDEPAPAATRPRVHDLAEVLDALVDDPRATHVEHLAPRPERTGELAVALDPLLRGRFGVDSLWAHQAEAIDLLRAGTSVAIATGTASGKSLCYQVPIAEAVSGATPATALGIFPTKALAQDQLRSMTSLEVPGLVAAAFDGDCTPEERTWVRANANVVLTNPEMLHHSLLPQHERWATFLHRLRFVVVDELHVLRGVFGSHVAHVLRRLRRLAEHYGARPTFVFTSATIGEPARLAEKLCGLPVVAVTDDASPRAARTFVLWDPARIDDDPDSPPAAEGRPTLEPTVWVDDEHPVANRPTGPTRRRSANKEAATITAQLVRRGVRTITFCRSRRGTEVVAADAARQLPRRLAEQVRPYRAGYLVSERRTIEAELFSGSLLGVVATSALELGIDIGGLDACVLNGFPGTIASLWQQAGRAGRGDRPALAVLVAGDDQLDQWFVAHPHEVFSRPPEPAVINADNDHVLLPHLACAAYELPLSAADHRFWDLGLDDAVRRLVLDDALRVRPAHRLVEAGPVAVWAGRGRPGEHLGLRGGSRDEVRIARANGSMVGTVDAGRAVSQVHAGAIYLHRGTTYRVTALDLDDLTAVVEPCNDAEYTQPRSETQVSILAVDGSTPLGCTHSHLGAVSISTQITGYKRIDTRTGAVLSIEPLDVPPQTLETRATWFTFAPEVIERSGVTADRLPGALHALEHASIAMLPLFTICDRWDVGGVSTVLQDDTGLPTIVIHDAYPGGAGLAELAWASAGELLAATRELIGSCPCDDGCPSCVQSPKCGNGNEPLDKAGALALAEAVLAT